MGGDGTPTSTSSESSESEMSMTSLSLLLEAFWKVLHPEISGCKLRSDAMLNIMASR